MYLDRHNKPIAAPQADEYSDDDDDYEAWGEFDEFGSSVSISRWSDRCLYEYIRVLIIIQWWILA